MSCLNRAILSKVARSLQYAPRCTAIRCQSTLPSSVFSSLPNHTTTYQRLLEQTPLPYPTHSQTITCTPHYELRTSDLSIAELYDRHKQRLYVIVGTSHEHQTSYQQVTETIKKIKPQTVMIEWCPQRFCEISEYTEFLKSDKMEFAAAIAGVERCKAQLVLGDLNTQLISTHFSSPWERLKASFAIIRESFRSVSFSSSSPSSTPTSISSTAISPDSFGVEFDPTSCLVNRHLRRLYGDFLKKNIPQWHWNARDLYMARVLFQCPGSKIVAVVGASHVEAVQDELARLIEFSSPVSLSSAPSAAPAPSNSLPSSACLHPILPLDSSRVWSYHDLLWRRQIEEAEPYSSQSTEEMRERMRLYEQSQRSDTAWLEEVEKGRLRS